MLFYEKLDFLMKLTNTTNSALSLYIKLDASYISRLRRGERHAPKNPDYMKAMAAYFAKTCKLDYQRKSLAEALKLPITAASYDELAGEIANWLTDKSLNDTMVVGDFLTGFANFSAGQAPCKYQTDAAADDYPQTDISVYYGVEGKRRGALHFLAAVAAQDKPRTLLLFSDEPTDWMTADKAYVAQWASYMKQVLVKGNRITIIHTVSRDLDEMLSAISQWMPLYMTGLIAPYFYPKKRDGIFRRTLFIAPGVAAMVSNSIGNSVEGTANFLFRNDDVIKTFAEEFLQYLRQCKPLMQIYTA